MSCVLRIVPWYDKDEWEKVYENAFSEDMTLRQDAYNSMIRWQNMRRACPHGVECTSALLQVILRDPDKSPFAPQGLNKEDLKLMYSAAVMRVVNLVCESGVKTKDTMLLVAKQNGIPNWIINIRHEVSHGTSIPDLDLLRRAVDFLITWVKGYYWEVEARSSRDLIIARPRGEVIEENLNSLIHIYRQLKKYEKLGTKKVSGIPEQQLRSEVCGMAKLRTNLILAEYIPWKYQMDQRPDLAPERLARCRLVVVLRLVLKMFKGYLKEDFCSYDTCGVVAKAMLQDEALDFGTWGQLIDRMHIWGRSLDLVQRLAALRSDENGEGATKWCAEIVKALLKRRRVAELEQVLSRERVGVEWDAGEREGEEGRALKRLLLKRRLHLKGSEAQGSSILEALFKRVEKAERRLRSALRLAVFVRLDGRDVKDTIRAVADRPTHCTIQVVKDLLDLLSPPMPESDRVNLITLMNLYIGKEDFAECNGGWRQAKGVADLVREWGEEMEAEAGEGVEEGLEAAAGDGQFHVSLATNYNWKVIPFGVIPWDSEGNPIPDYLLPIK